MLTANLILLQPDLKRLKETCIAFDVPEEHDQPERPYISFKMTEVHPTTATAEERITIRKRGHYAYCQHRVLGHSRNAPRP